MSLYEINGIVHAGSPVETIGVRQVRATDDYKLFLEFTNGEQRVYNALTLINDGVFKQLQNPEIFMKAYVDSDTVVWNGTLDISPEFLYENSKTVKTERIDFYNGNHT